MPKFPFTYFDYFAYLLVGLPIIWAFDYSKEGILESSISSMSSTEKWVFIILTAFLVGQVVSFFAHHFFQEWVIAKILGRPSDNLLGISPKSFRKFMKNRKLMKNDVEIVTLNQCMEAEACSCRKLKISQCLPQHIRKKINNRAANELGLSEKRMKPKWVWSQAFRHARWDKRFAEIYASLFVTLIFSRNMGTALFLAAAILVVNKLIHGNNIINAETLHIIWAFFIVSIVLLWRFLVMFRAYSKAVLMNYAYPIQEKSGSYQR